MKRLLFISIGFFSFFIASSQDTISSSKPSVSELKEIQLNTVKAWEKLVERSREKGDVEEEIRGIMDIIYFKTNELGDNTTSYQDAVYLEKLTKENPGLEASREVKASLNMFIGCLLRDQFKLQESVSYFETAIKAAKENNQDEFYIDSSLHLAEVLGRLNQDKKALEMFAQLEKETANEDRVYGVSRVYEILTYYYLNKEEHDNALLYSLKSIDYSASPQQLSQRLSFVSRCYNLKGTKLDSAIYYGVKALKIANENGLERAQLNAHENLRLAYSKQGNYEQAYYHFEKFYELEQEQRSFDNALQIGNINLEREKEASKLQQELADERLSNQRLVIWLVSGGLVLLIGGLLYIFNRLKFIRRQNKIIDQEKRRAQESEKAKEQFLANMSHEIRTPMHAISGMINALRRRDHSKDQAAYLEAMKISSDNLLVILNDVLDMSKIESGNLEIATIPIDVIAITNNVVNLLSYKAEEKGLQLNFNAPSKFPKHIQGDPVRLNQILVNLVGNAIKFTEEGSITIKLSANNNKLQFAIKDTGIGISEISVKTIFDSFKQGEDALTKRYAGTGLGLSITKQLIDLQEGRIWVESELGKGSVFYFELPLIEVSATEALGDSYTEQELKDIGSSLKGLRLLIAEDNSFNVMVVRDDLAWYIPEVNLTFVEDGKEAIKNYKENSYDIILMDVQMPELNGYEATRQIRQIEETTQASKTPIIAMTASLLKDQIDRCYQAGMDAYIPKPYKPFELMSTLKGFFKD